MGMLIAISALTAQSSLAQGGDGQGGGGMQGQNRRDINKNGIEDGLEDADGDGILNRADDDYAKTNANMRDVDSDGTPNGGDANHMPVQDGSGNQTNMQSPQTNGLGQTEEQGVHNPGMGLVSPEEAGLNDEQGLRQQESAGQIMRRYKNPELESRVAVMQQEQVVAQNLIQKNLQAAGRRSGLVKFFMGSDQDLLTEIKSRLTQHEEKIKQLQMIESQTTDAADKLLLTEQLQSMEQVSTQLKTALAEGNNNVFSLLGWAFKLFN